MSITMDTYFDILDVVESLPVLGDYFPTMSELKESNIESNPEKYMPYIMYLLELDVAKNMENIEVYKYLNDIVKRTCVE